MNAGNVEKNKGEYQSASYLKDKGDRIEVVSHGSSVLNQRNVLAAPAEGFQARGVAADKERGYYAASNPACSHHAQQLWIKPAKLPQLHQVLDRQSRGGIPMVSHTHIGLNIPSVNMLSTGPTSSSSSVAPAAQRSSTRTDASASHPYVLHCGNKEQRQVMQYQPVTDGSTTPPPLSAARDSKRRERWTDEEHENFLMGLERHGRKWKKIQAYVKTKTPIQVPQSFTWLLLLLLRFLPLMRECFY